MTKQDLLKHIASSGYNVGFGAKKTFATYDIVSKVPGWIGMISLFVSVLGLYIDEVSTKNISAVFIFLSIGALYINFYDAEKASYQKAGDEQTRIFRKIQILYYDAKGEETPDASAYNQKLDELMNSFSDSCITKQIFGSNWYAHYKFFSEMEKRWVEEELNLTFWKDKIPKSLILSGVLLVIILIAFTW